MKYIDFFQSPRGLLELDEMTEGGLNYRDV